MIEMSAEALLPLRWHMAGGTRNRLLDRVVRRWRERRADGIALGDVIPEPVLAGLVALGDPVAGFGGVAAGVPGRRRVAAAHVATACAATKMKPPPVRGQAFGAARTAGRNRWIDVRVSLDRDTLADRRQPGSTTSVPPIPGWMVHANA